MNNEPVAWAREDGVIAFHKQKEVDSQGFKWFPLYTHPVKKLTEWEIKECWEEATEMQEHFCSQYFDFAQLILRKAQEK
jgi:hypothetical protein